MFPNLTVHFSMNVHVQAARLFQTASTTPRSRMSKEMAHPLEKKTLNSKICMRKLSMSLFDMCPPQNRAELNRASAAASRLVQDCHALTS